ncbi:protein crumbs homolog 1 [Bombina bombina]|uniref:protein crumbs homolog 1 n=1 Tax=Bombina bombina TaxID=8345 RepID=UPI00235B2406|nr:protein crumbs homolog 1 [Bombina bombina]
MFSLSSAALPQPTPHLQTPAKPCTDSQHPLNGYKGQGAVQLGTGWGSSCLRSSSLCHLPPCEGNLPCTSQEDCDEGADICFSNPCPVNSSCVITAQSYTCQCPRGYGGQHCEIPLELCARNPCRQGGQCYMGDEGPICVCSSGYRGTLCDAPEDECLFNPCLNGAVCRDRGKGPACYCVPGFQGSLCDIEVDECASQPCMHGATCLNLIGRYTCVCPAQYTGVHCEDNNECESSPCQNGGICENIVAGYHCHCLSLPDSAGHYYGGRDCEKLLVGCRGQRCLNGGSCVPALVEGEHTHSCLCPAGFTDPTCRTQTTFSFNGKTILSLWNGTFRALTNISLRFQTVQTSAVILYLRGPERSLTVYLQNGYLFLSSSINKQVTVHIHLSLNVSDDHWHTLQITVSNHLTLRLLDNTCAPNCGNSSVQDLSANTKDHSFEDLLLGGEPPPIIEEENGSKNAEQKLPGFIGCMQDITVDSTLLSERYEMIGNVQVGCKRTDHCIDQPCNNRGRCINLWLSYQCDCYRPYRGTNCSSVYEAAGFGFGDMTSYAVFQIDTGESYGITISTFVRTWQESGLLLALGTITLSLEDGKLTLRAVSDLTLRGQAVISDGQSHLVTLNVSPLILELFVSSQLQGQLPVHVQRLQATNMLYVGGLGDPKLTAQRGGYLKGCVQDLRVDGWHLEFFPQSELVPGNRILNNVTKGCSIDKFCQPGLCLNGGVCHSSVDDFACTCPTNTTGKVCENINWCLLSPCPPGSICQPVASGYECVTSAVFRGSVDHITYRSNEKIVRDLTNLTLGFRTHATDSVLLHAERDPESLTVSIHESRLLFQLQSGNSFYSVSLSGLEPVNDGQWHNVTLSMTVPESESSLWQMEVDSHVDKIFSSVATGNLNFLKEDVEIFLGAHSNGTNTSFTGCLDTILIGGIHLPYFTDADFPVVKPQEEQFVKMSPSSVDIGCLHVDPCPSNPCTNGGTCHDALTHPLCTCPSGWTGIFCETDINYCLPNPCLHGNCTNGVTGYKCECQAGYTGANCNISNCKDQQCATGATCIEDTNGYTCLCPNNFTGRLCSLSSSSEASALGLVRIINRVQSTLCKNEKENITCYNFSNCTEEGEQLKCICQPGFVGKRCEIDFDECVSDPCLNGGICQNLPDRFHCICDVNFAGERCEIDLSEFQPPGVFTAVASVVLALFFVVCAGLCIFIAVAGLRSNQGTYSPSRQEKEGSRVEMWNIVQPPPLERLI